MGKMSAIVHVKRDGDPRAVAELIGLYDTPEMITAIKNKYETPGRSICVYPDPHGNARKSVGASDTDISLLEDAGFSVIVEHGNPAVKDRVNCMNAAFCNADNHRTYKVNVSACPIYTLSIFLGGMSVYHYLLVA